MAFSSSEGGAPPNWGQGPPSPPPPGRGQGPASQPPPPNWFFQDGQWYNQPYAPDGTCLVKEDRTMAMLSHVLAIFSGFIGPLIIYLVKKDDSKYVAFHALQALYFSLVVLVAAIALSFLCLGFIPWIGGLIYQIILAIRANDGKWEKYWLAGDWAMSSVMHLHSRR